MEGYLNDYFTTQGKAVNMWNSPDNLKSLFKFRAGVFRGDV
jgi:hypothetical protein